MLTIPIFFCILADRAIWSPPASLWFCYCCTGLVLIWVLGFNLYRWFRICQSVVGRGMGQSFLSSKRLPDIFPALGQGVLAHTGAFSNGGGLFSDVEGFWLSEFTGALAFVWGGCMVSLPGSSLATTFTLFLFVGIRLFLFSVTLDPFLTWGLGSG